MKNIMRLVCLTAVICLLSVSAAFAQEPELPSTGLSTSVDLGYVSQYIWRGIPLNTDPAFQPSITISHPSGLSFNLWGSMDTTNIAGKSGDLTEADYTLNYAWETKGREMNAGVSCYTYPNTTDSGTSEIFMSMCFGGTLAATLSANYDIDEADGYYLTLGVGHDCATAWKKAPKLGLSAKVSYGSDKFVKYYYNGYSEMNKSRSAKTAIKPGYYMPQVNKSAFTDVILSVSMPYTMKNGMTLAPNVNYTMIIDSDIKDVMKAAREDRNNFFAGVTLSTSF
ncbi:MAG: TorF family putative porin [Armatimonadota bacterium]